MKVGVVGPIWLNIPPKGYGGTEEVVYNLVNGLVENGHDVTLFGPKTAQVKSKVYSTVEIPLIEQGIDWNNISYSLFHLTEAFDHASSFDILHVHLNKSQDYMALPLALSSPVPVMFTFHFKLPTPTFKKDRYKILKKYSRFPFISISNSQRENLPFNFISTVYNAFDIDRFPFSEKTEDYFVWLGKVNPLKGTKEAITAARKAGVKLIMLGAIEEHVPEMLAYYEKEVKPLIDGKQIVWVGEVGVEEKVKILGEAKAFLNPIAWEEPFGLVMTEAQAVGTPVISMNRGAAPEIIEDGKTGFLVKSLDEMVEKIDKVDIIKRTLCRRNIEKRFTLPKMIEGYEEAYKNTIKNWDAYLASQKASLKNTQTLQ